MNYYDWYTRNIPEYYNTMYLDGYAPYEIMQAFHKSAMRRNQELKATYEAMQTKNKTTKIKVTSEVKVK